MLGFEIVGSIRGNTRTTSVAKVVDTQNVIDYLSIFYSYAFCALNIATVHKLFPLIPDNAASDSKAIKKDPSLRISDDMPIAGIVCIWLSLG